MTALNAQQVWEEALAILLSESSQNASFWFEGSKVVLDDEKLVLLASNDFNCNFILSHYQPQLLTALQRAAGKPVELLISCPARYNMSKPEETEPLKPVLQQKSNLNPKYTFSTFIVGKANSYAHAAAYAVSQNPGNAYNPLFLYSGVGLGKTHLMHAIGHSILEKNPDARILYITSEDFTNDLITSISRSKMPEFRERYRNVDVLMVDDIQFIVGKEQTQEEFFHTFNALHALHKQIVISSDRHPKDISPLEERLRSRFEWGVTADISKPDFETRVAILRKKAELDNLNVPDEVNIYIASKIESNIRELEGCLNNVVAYANLTRAPLSENLAAEVLHAFLPDKDPRRITIDLIMAVTADYYGLTVDDLKSKRRSRDITVPRQVAMYLCREMTQESLPRIGMTFDRDHTTVIHAIEKIAGDVKRDSALRSAVEDMKKRILGA